jgi:hypothetical protein
MDPETLLARLRERAQRAVDQEGKLTDDAVTELAQDVLDLDTWLATGGALPRDWRRR